MFVVDVVYLGQEGYVGFVVGCVGGYGGGDGFFQCGVDLVKLYGQVFVLWCVVVGLYVDLVFV